MNLEYGEGESCTKSLIIGIKPAYYIASFFKHEASSGEKFVHGTNLSVTCTHTPVPGHIQIVKFSGSVDQQVRMTYF